ncbi:MAG: LamG domain-containing protein, partial [Nanoarchaeota archaeon]|nr:LamG domain-containing protein [Nanoarchaeota archaeon]
MFFAYFAFAVPAITFYSPTDANNSFVSRTWTYVNTSISDAGNVTAFIDFDRGLVGWWRFNNESGENSTKFRDWSAYGNNGTCVGSNCPTNTTGKFGNALDFDGVDDYVVVPYSASLEPDYITVEAWIYPPTGIPQGYFVSNWNSSSNGSFLFQITLTGNLQADIANATEGIATSQMSISKDAWHHTAITYNGTDFKLYLDGNLSDTKNVTGILRKDSNPLFIGNRFDLKRNFSGNVDEVKIWNRALSPEEINASYNAGVYRLYHNFTNTPDGIYNYTAYAQDLAGNVNQTATKQVVIDANPPYGIYACQNLTRAGGSYILMQNVSSAGTCFTIKENNVTLDGAGYTINYSKTAAGYAIDNQLGYNFTTIKNANILQGNSTPLSSYAI